MNLPGRDGKTGPEEGRARERTPPDPRHRRGSVRAFRVAAILLPVALLFLAELALRLAGYGCSPDFFLTRRDGAGKWLSDNPKFGWRFFPPSQARLPQPFYLPAEKGAGACRIFVLGESAAMGDPDPDFGFPRVLEALLRDKFPGARFEVVNAAMTAINSHAILPIARDCARRQGDFWVIYMGNNEVTGPFGAGTVFGRAVPPRTLVQVTLAWRATRLGQAFEALARRLKGDTSRGWQGMEMFQEHYVAESDPRMRRVYDHFQRNLEDILAAGVRAGVTQIVCTVGSNLRDCPPFASLHGPGYSGGRREDWDRAYTNGIGAEAAGRLLAATDLYASAARIDPDFAELQFRQGRCLLERGQFDEARHCYQWARDLDALRFRADTRINQILVTQASNRAGEHIHLLDAEALLAAHSRYRISGDEVFYEHVHLRFEGNYVLARAVAKELAALLPEAITRRAGTNEWLSVEQAARRLGWNDWSQHRVLQKLQDRISRPPFAGQPGHAQRMDALEAALAQIATDSHPGQIGAAIADYREALDFSPGDPVLHRRLAELLSISGDRDGALKEYEAARQLWPYFADNHLDLGSLYNELKRPKDARACFENALSLDSGSFEALNGLGVTCALQEQFPEAVRWFKRAAKAQPGELGVRVNLAAALEKERKPAEALAVLEESVRLRPGDPSARVALGKFHLRQGQGKAAEAQLSTAAKHFTNSADIHVLLGMAFELQNDPAQASSQYQRALELDPANESARRRLGQLPEGR